MVFEIVNELFDSAFMSFARETMGLLILVVKIGGIGFLAYCLLKLVFEKKRK